MSERTETDEARGGRSRRPPEQVSEIPHELSQDGRMGALEHVLEGGQHRNDGFHEVLECHLFTNRRERIGRSQ